jgi:hypothetical protein
MQITLLTEPQARAVLNHALAGDLAPGDAAADLIRQEVSARRGSPRHFLLGRVCRLAAPAITLDPELVDDVCDDLERQGDILVADGGFLYPAPVRIVTMGDGAFRFFCAVPSWRLFAAIEGEWTRRGVRRDCRPFGSIDQATEALGGVVLTPEMWAGLDRVPPADAEWIRSLKARLAWNPAAAGSLERDEPLEWSGLLVDQDEPRWRAAGSAQLWRARHRWKRWVYAWTAGDPPRTQPFISLHPDEGTRTAFAVARVAERPFRAIIDRRLPIPTIELPSWLPSAEYRYVSQFGEVTGRLGARATLAIQPGQCDAVESLLGLRLGMAFDHVASDAGPAEPSPPVAPVVDSADSPGAKPSSISTAVLDLSARSETVIEKYGLRTTEDLKVWLSSDESSRARNVGNKTRQELETLLRALGENAGQAVPLPPRGQFADHSDLDAVVRDYGDLPTESLGRIQGRLRTTIKTESLVTVGDFVAWLKQVDPKAQANYGLATHECALSMIRDLRQHGLSQLVFGRETPPATAAEFYSTYLDQLDADVREIFEKYYRDGATLDQIGRARETPVTRERIRQIIRVNIDGDIPAWRETAQRVFAAALFLLETGSGVAPLESCMEAIGATRLEHLVLLAELAEQPLCIQAFGANSIAALLPREELFRLRQEISGEIEDALAYGGSYKQVEAVLHAWGIQLSETDSKKLLTALVGAQFKGDVVYSNRRKTQTIYVEALRKGGRAMSAREVSEAVLASSPDEPASPRNVVAHFGRSREVFNVGGWQWIHAESLGISRAELKEIAASCLDLVPRSGGAVSVKHLLKQVSLAHPNAGNLSPYVVRDEMIHSGLVRGWRMGCDVAWRVGNSASRLSIADWIGLVAETLDQPFLMSELVARVAELAGTTEESVLVQAMQSEDLMNLDHGEYLLRQYAFPGDGDFGHAREFVASCIPADDVVSLRELAQTIDLSRIHGAKDEPRLVWAVVKTMDGIQSRARGHLLWRAELGNNTWVALRKGRKYNVQPIFKCRHFAPWLRSAHLIEPDRFAYSLVQEAVQSGHLLSCGRGWYMDTLAAQVAIETAIDTTPEFERLVRGDQDFVRDSPARAWLNASRKRRGLFEVWD